ncbi:MAG TPA: VOC family protein [Gaiellaceae bacterium]|jgi:catechol 2,3-dioxygenase|nr:VOC family protein [Gaiellaceae bacterium]
MTETVRDLAHLSHVELLTPKPDESLHYFRGILGMEVEAERGDSVYLRCFGDYERASLKLTHAPSSGVGHLAYRTHSPEALDRRVAALEANGAGGEWHDGDLGHGRAYSFLDPDGHRFELFYESERYVAPPELKPSLKNQPQRYPGRGVGVRHLDHINFLAVDPGENRAFLEANLGLRLTEQIVLDDGREAGVWLASNQKSYDVTYTRDMTGTRGRLHHIAFFVDQREDVLRGADIFLEHGIVMESGPHKHAIQQTFFLYTWEPGGNRIEVCAGGYLIFDPAHEPVVWSQAERAKGQAWGMQTVASFHIKGSPPVAQEEELLAGH